MRVVLLLTVGLPVFATQLVALALPGVEMVRFVPLRQLPAETHQQAQDEARVPAPRGAHRLGLAAHAPAGVGFIAAPQPEDVSARALRFVVLRHRQAT